MLGEEAEGGDRGAPLPREVGVGHQPAQGRPAGAPLGEHGDPRQPLVDAGTPTGRGTPGRRPPARPRVGPARPRPPGRHVQRHGGHREVGAEDGPDARRGTGLGETDGAVHAVAVGEGERVHPVVGGPLHQQVRVGGAMAQRISARDVQVDEGVAHGAPPPDSGS